MADLSGSQIGQSTEGHITFDSDAAGSGWFVDPTPNDNAEFAHTLGATRLQTDPTEAAAGHMDLLTAVMHEMGHQLGLDDNYDPAARDDLMFGSLTTGERRLPDAIDVVHAAEFELPASAQPAAGTPIVAGTYGNDVINAGAGGNILLGGAGADTFVFDQNSTAECVVPCPGGPHRGLQRAAGRHHRPLRAH